MWRLFAFVMGIGTCSAPVSQAGPLPAGATVVQLFEWRWDDIGAECSRLAASGITFVHVSPPTEHAQVPGSPWYDRYQPASYAFGNRSGDEASFRQMITTCRSHGVGILVDTVINHMAIIPPEGVQRFGTLGTGYWRYSFPGQYAWWDFHRCDRNPPDSHIKNYKDRYEVQHCNLSGLADLATGTDYVRNTLASYLQRLADWGVAGFRVDAAKHIPSEDIAEIIRRTARPGLHIFQEVIGVSDEPVKPEEYLQNGAVSEFGFAAAVGWRFRDRNLAGLMTDLSRLGLPAEDAVVFIDNHDSQRGHGAGQSALTYRNGRIYELANAFMLAWPYGTPILMSSYRFEDDQIGPPRNIRGEVSRVPTDCGDSRISPWVCEHRWPLIANMTRFRRLTGSAPVRALAADDREIAFSRGESAFFAVNLNTHEISRTYPTTLPAGTYCNLLDARDGQSPQPCPDGSLVTVDANGTASVRIDALSALAIHTEL
jgi:alpha-amylase